MIKLIGKSRRTSPKFVGSIPAKSAAFRKSELYSTRFEMQSVSRIMTPSVSDKTNKKNLLQELAVVNLLVIASSDTGADPRAMVIELVNAVVANVTMRSPQWSEDVACFAEL
jgi:di/tricarboxylate transporter